MWVEIVNWMWVFYNEMWVEWVNATGSTHHLWKSEWDSCCRTEGVFFYEMVETSICLVMFQNIVCWKLQENIPSKCVGSMKNSSLTSDTNNKHELQNSWYVLFWMNHYHSAISLRLWSIMFVFFMYLEVWRALLLQKMTLQDKLTTHLTNVLLILQKWNDIQLHISRHGIFTLHNFLGQKRTLCGLRCEVLFLSSG